ncbi:MAG: hypothetical protein HXY46_11270 [Syntrophaceae bacterium]|nr:hypothetical protein [Syntrophaceae bacterium]
MIYVPQELETTARRWVATYEEAWRMMEEISQACFERFREGKQKLNRQRKAEASERRSHR